MSSTKKHFKAFSTLIITIETQEEIGNIIEIDETNKELYNYYWEKDQEKLTDSHHTKVDIWNINECIDKEEWIDCNPAVYCDFYQIRLKAQEDNSAREIQNLFNYYKDYCIILSIDGRISYSNKNCYIPAVLPFIKDNEEPLCDLEIEDL